MMRWTDEVVELLATRWSGIVVYKITFWLLQVEGWDHYGRGELEGYDTFAMAGYSLISVLRRGGADNAI